jgi:hypothetical protein
VELGVDERSLEADWKLMMDSDDDDEPPVAYNASVWFELKDEEEKVEGNGVLFDEEEDTPIGSGMFTLNWNDPVYNMELMLNDSDSTVFLLQSGLQNPTEEGEDISLDHMGFYLFASADSAGEGQGEFEGSLAIEASIVDEMGQAWVNITIGEDEEDKVYGGYVAGTTQVPAFVGMLQIFDPDGDLFNVSVNLSNSGEEVELEDMDLAFEAFAKDGFYTELAAKVEDGMIAAQWGLWGADTEKLYGMNVTNASYGDAAVMGQLSVTGEDDMDIFAMAFELLGVEGNDLAFDSFDAMLTVEAKEVTTVYNHFTQLYCGESVNNEAGILTSLASRADCQELCDASSTCKGYHATNANWNGAFWCVLVDSSTGPAGSACDTPSQHHTNWDSYFKVASGHWALIHANAFCEVGDQYKSFDGITLSQCQALVVADPDCSNIMFSNGDMCRCIFPSETCDAQPSSTSNSVYEWQQAPTTPAPTPAGGTTLAVKVRDWLPDIDDVGLEIEAAWTLSDDMNQIGSWNLTLNFTMFDTVEYNYSLALDNQEEFLKLSGVAGDPLSVNIALWTPAEHEFIFEGAIELADFGGPLQVDWALWLDEPGSLVRRRLASSVPSIGAAIANRTGRYLPLPTVNTKKASVALSRFLLGKVGAAADVQGQAVQSRRRLEGEEVWPSYNGQLSMDWNEWEVFEEPYLMITGWLEDFDGNFASYVFSFEEWVLTFNLNQGDDGEGVPWMVLNFDLSEFTSMYMTMTLYSALYDGDDENNEVVMTMMGMTQEVEDGVVQFTMSLKDDMDEDIYSAVAMLENRVSSKYTINGTVFDDMGMPFIRTEADLYVASTSEDLNCVLELGGNVDLTVKTGEEWETGQTGVAGEAFMDFADMEAWYLHPNSISVGMYYKEPDDFALVDFGVTSELFEVECHDNGEVKEVSIPLVGVPVYDGDEEDEPDEPSPSCGFIPTHVAEQFHARMCGGGYYGM